MKLLVELIYRLATGRRRARMVSAPLFAGFFLALLVLTVTVALKADRALGINGLLPHPWQELIAVPLLGLGAFLWAWSVVHFARAGGSPIPASPPPRLVTSGPYARSRNPMLGGVFLLLFGTGFLLGSPSLVFVLGPLFVVGSLLEFRFVEEPELEKRLGEAYRTYRQQTPMVIPRRLW